MINMGMGKMTIGAEDALQKGIALHRQGRLRDALHQFEQALALSPGDADLSYHQGLTLWSLGRRPEALAAMTAAIAARPGFSEAQFNRGAMLQALGRPADALAAFDAVLALNPHAAAAWNGRGGALRLLDRSEDALAAFDRALSLQPDFLPALHNRAGMLQAMGRPADALAGYDAVLRLQPRHADALYNRALALEALRRPGEALDSLDRALKAGAAGAELLVRRGNLLWVLRRLPEALDCFDRAALTAPDAVAPRLRRGGVLYEMHRPEDALAAYESALMLKPEDADIEYNRANVLVDLKRLEEGHAGFARALALAPDHPHALSGLAASALEMCDWDRTQAIAAQLRRDVEQNRSAVLPFVLLGYSDDPALQRQCAENYRGRLVPRAPPPLWNGECYRHRKIRIAYLSADFNHHATGILMADLFERHDRARFDVHALSYGRDDGSAMRARLVKAFDHFHEIGAMSDEAAARLLRALEIDIAVDLKGYTALARPEILSYRPCPVQVNYLGYPGTMGAEFVDYVLGDATVTPFDQAEFYREKIVQLPECYQANDAARAIAPVTLSRAEMGLPEGFVFCSFNVHRKIGRPVFAVWMRLLAGVPGSALWLLVNDETARRNLRREAAVRGIDEDRLVFAGRLDHDAHLARHRLADLFLDTMPYNSHTTASDALWAGLPIVTCRGASFAARVAASLLKAAGLPALVTDNLADYESLAFKLARDPVLLSDLRARLAANRLTCPLFDSAGFTRGIERAYETMWRRAEAGEPPAAFAVDEAS
jgi:predicted O-linked N-acetylglucosamine transferase (SPINDLY family)